jgi:hypothetical protein
MGRIPKPSEVCPRGAPRIASNILGPRRTHGSAPRILSRRGHDTRQAVIELEETVFRDPPLVRPIARRPGDEDLLRARPHALEPALERRSSVDERYRLGVRRRLPDLAAEQFPSGDRDEHFRRRRRSFP